MTLIVKRCTTEMLGETVKQSYTNSQNINHSTYCRKSKCMYTLTQINTHRGGQGSCNRGLSWRKKLIKRKGVYVCVCVCEREGGREVLGSPLFSLIPCGFHDHNSIDDYHLLNYYYYCYYYYPDSSVCGYVCVGALVMSPVAF